MNENQLNVVFVDLLNLFYDQHGIYSLASVLRSNNINVYFVKERHAKKALSKVAALQPDAVLYSSFSASMPIYAAFDSWVKQTVHTVSIMGGPGPTFDPDYIHRTSIDAFCIGEGEIALIDFLQNGFRANKNIIRQGSIGLPSEFYPFVDLDRLPFPDRKTVYDVDVLLRNMPSKQFFSGRGCPYDCTYCFNHSFREMFKDCGPQVRKKSVDYLLEEIRMIKKNYPLANVVFNDDTFILNKKWLFEFCHRFPREIGLSYTCNIRANLFDEDIAEALHASHCIGVNWSIESGNAYLRNTVLRRAMTDEQILRTANLLTQHKIPYRIGNMIGLPGETFAQIYETIDLNIRAKPYLGLANIFVPYPGLQLTRYAIENGYFHPRSDLPKDYFTTSVMNISCHENTKIKKLMCLFPMLIAFPRMFYNRRILEVLLKVPYMLLRIIHEIIYTFKMQSMYKVKASLTHKCHMALRYLYNL